MAQGRTHPHVESPAAGDILRALESRSAEIQDIYLQLHELVLATLPGVNSLLDTVDGATGYGTRQYDYGGWGMLALMPAKGWVNLVFMQGAELADPHALLEGSAKSMRSVRFRKSAEIVERAAAVAELLTAASRLKTAE